MILIWDMGIGGVQKRVRDLIIDISKNQPDWHIYLLIKYHKESLFIDKIKDLDISIRYFSHQRSRARSVFLFFWLLVQFVKIKPTVALTFLDNLSFFLVLVKKCVFWLPCKIVLNEGAFTSNFIKLNRNKYWRLLVRWSYKYANLILAPTQAIKKDLSYNFGVPEKLIQVIPNWSLFKPSTQQKNKNIDLLFIGRFENEKDPLSFVRIVHDLKNTIPTIRAYMLGSGSLENEIHNYISIHTLRSNITVVSPRNPVSYILRSKVFVLTSLNEGMPNVVIEAALNQVPTVSNNFMGSSEVIKNGITGYICETNQEMTKRSRLLLNNPRDLLKMGKAAQKEAIVAFGPNNQKKFIASLLATNP